MIIVVITPDESRNAGTSIAGRGIGDCGGGDLKFFSGDHVIAGEKFCNRRPKDLKTASDEPKIFLWRPRYHWGKSSRSSGGNFLIVGRWFRNFLPEDRREKVPRSPAEFLFSAPSLIFFSALPERRAIFFSRTVIRDFFAGPADEKNRRRSWPPEIYSNC
ncbi:MAG: hypothetical protein ABIR47_10915 [Candidatus Kapaibacterium sp.]